jgi:hypothetical protein
MEVQIKRHAGDKELIAQCPDEARQDARAGIRRCEHGSDRRAGELYAWEFRDLGFSVNPRSASPKLADPIGSTYVPWL